MNDHIAASMLAGYKSTSQFGHPCTFVKTQVWMHLALLQTQLCNLCCQVKTPDVTAQLARLHKLCPSQTLRIIYKNFL